MDTHAFRDMFVLTLPLVEKILRPVLVYVFLIIALRLSGKRQLAQLNPFDLVVLLTLSNTVQNAIIGEDNTITGGMIGAGTLMFVNYMVVKFVYNHERLERFVEGTPDALIEGGVIQVGRLKQELITLSELLAAAHKQGFDSLEDIDSAVLDPGGAIFFSAKKPTADEARHARILARLDRLSAQVAELRS
jgi:uncharacterized membrane protein YcaP (DUF421 family)